VGALLMLVVAGWSLAYAIQLGSPDLSTKRLWSSVSFLALVSAPILWFIFVLQYTHRARWLTSRHLILLALPSLLTLALVWTDSTFGLIRSAVSLDVDGPIPILDITYGGGFWAFWVYASLLVLLGGGMILHALAASPRLYQRQSATVLVAALVPWIGNVMYLIDLNPLHGLDLTPFSFAVTGIAVAWGLFRYRLLDIAPIARDVVLESGDDGVMVVDAQNRIVDANPVAGRLIGHSVSEIIGQPADQVLSAWPGMFKRYRDVTEAHTEIALGTGGRQRYYDLHISPLYDRRDHLVGRQFVLRNITGRKRTEESLQEERRTFLSILQKAPYGVLLIDQDERCLHINSEFTHITGLTLGDISTVADWFHQAFPDPEHRQEVIERWKSDTAQGASEAFSVVSKGGQVKEVELRTTLLDDGKAILTLSDITERKQAEERLKQRSRELTLLNRASQAFSSTLDVNHVLATVLEGARHLLEVTACSIWLIDRETDELVCLQATGPKTEIVRDWQLPPWQGIAGQTARTGKSLIVQDTQADEHHFKGLDQQTGLPLRSVLSIPLRVKQEVIGVLQAVDVQIDRFDAADLTLLKPLASSAAIAVENARLFAQAQQEIAERKRVEEALRESERKFKNLAEQSPNMIFINQKDRVVYANERFEEVMGYTRDELYSEKFDFLTLIAPEHRELVKASFDEQIEGEETEPGEHAFVTQDGVRIEAILTTRSIDYAGERAILGTVTDITERKQVEKERERLLAQVQEQAQRVQQIIDTVPEGVFLLDPGGHVILANPMAERDLAALANAGMGDIIAHLGGHPLADLLAAPPKGLWHEVATDGQIFQIVARPLGARAKPGGWMLVTRDVTQQREIERRNQQQERLAAVGQMAAGIAEDFDDVMAAIILHSQTAAQSEGLSAQDRERMATISQQAQYATQLVKQALDPSRRPGLEGQPLDVPARAMGALAKGNGETILVVEDSTSARKAVVDSLEVLNYRVVEATTGHEALAMLELHGDDIALVLSDVGAPGAGGVALLHALRARGLPARVVMLTSHPMAKEMENLRAQGMIDWLPKPPSLEQLAEVVAQALGPMW
jgi:PAS domain S-box-containing protein